MILTNKHGLPTAVVRAILNDPYPANGDWDFSVTKLLQPPQLARLSKSVQIEEDAADRIWSLLGQSVDIVLERAAVDIPGIFKRRFFANRLGYKISGEVDHFEEGILTDYKVTSVYAREGKVEWEAQLNLLRILMAEEGVVATRLQNVLIFRDWRPKEALQKDDYPESQVAVLPVDLWSVEKAEEFLAEKIREHTADVARPCTDEERWAQPEKWALMKKGAKRAIKLFEQKPGSGLVLSGDQYLEHRPGAFRRCESYCPVSAACPQWAATVGSKEAA